MELLRRLYARLRLQVNESKRAIDVAWNRVEGAWQVAAGGRRWWYNSALLINAAFPIRYFDELGVPRLAA